MRRTTTLPVAAALAAAAVLMSPAPAQATVHEIVGQWCSGHDPLEPPGISQFGSKNFAKPLFASGAIELVPYDPPGSVDAALLVDFQEGHPALKISTTGVIIPIGTGPGGLPLYLELFTLDPGFPAFQNCPKLAG